MEFETKAWDFDKSGIPSTIEVSFSLNYRDWCKLEKSHLWQKLTKAVARIQRKDNRSCKNRR